MLVFKHLDMRWLILWLVLWGGGMMTPPPQNESLMLDDYWLLVETTESGLGDANVTLATRQELAGVWGGVSSVQVREGQVVLLENGWLVGQLLDEDVPAFIIQQQLQTLLDHRDTFRTANVDGDEAMRLLAGILSQEEFVWENAEPSRFDEWRTNFWNRINDFFARFSDGDGNLVGIDFILSAIAVILLSYVLYQVVEGVATDFFVREATLNETIEADEFLTAESALTRAQNLSGGGDYRTAVRYLYLSALLSLEEHGLLRYDRSLTNREYLHSVAHVPQVGRILAEVVGVFDRVWYGYQPIDEATYQHYEAQVKTLQAKKI